MKKLLIICPSIRTKRAMLMYESLRNTSDADVLFLSEKGSITDLINRAYRFSRGYDYYHITNDDFIYRTKNWDKILVDKIESSGGWGIAYGSDLYLNEALPTAPVISRNIIDALGWIQLPTLEHLCGDMVWNYIGKKIDALFYVKDVVIEHQHFLNNKAEKDDVYQKTNSKEMFRKDHESFRNWVQQDSERDIKRVVMAMLEMQVPC